MKKILHILVLPKLAGSQRISLEILHSLPDSDFEKWVLFSDEMNGQECMECHQAFECAGANVIYSHHLRRAIGIKDIAAMWEIYRLCRREKFDIVHTHSTKPGIIGRIAATIARVPYVIHTVHGVAFHKFIGFPKWQFYWCCEMLASLFCDKIVMVNQYYNRYFHRFGKKTVTIYNGLDFSLLPLPRHVANNQFKVLFVGRLDGQKDPLTLLQAAKIVVQRFPNVRFTLVGDGEEYGKCKLFIEENGLIENVCLTGWKNNVESYYNTHDLFIAPSIYEAFGLMFIEAGYYGLPTVATDVEGIPEVVVDNVTGLLCKPKRPDMLAENIIRLMENESLRVTMGRAAYERAINVFSSQRMTEQYKALYK